MSESKVPKNPRTVEVVRTSLRNYPEVKEKFFLTGLIRSYALTLEVFLHSHLGERYITWPRMLLGLVIMWLFSQVGLPWNWQKVYILVATISLPVPFLVEIERIFGFSIKIPIVAATEFQGVSVVGIMLAAYVSAAHWRLIEIFIMNRFAVDMHNRSSGEPWPIWDELYIVFDRLNFRGDLVKQFCEPLFCFVIGLLTYPLATFRGVSFWLMSAALALFIKAWIENNARKKLVLDRIASRMDLASLRAQQIGAASSQVEESWPVPKLLP